MTTRVITKALATEQDLAYGEGVVEQTRAGTSYELDMIRGFRPCNSQEELFALDPAKFPKACLVQDGTVAFYSWDGTKYALVSTTNTPFDPDAVEVTSTGSTTPRTLSDRFADVVNVKDFGATGVYADDATDAFEAMIAHINTLKSGTGSNANSIAGVKIVIPPGIYTITRQIQFELLMHFSLEGNMAEIYYNGPELQGDDSALTFLSCSWFEINGLYIYTKMTLDSCYRVSVSSLKAQGRLRLLDVWNGNFNSVWSYYDDVQILGGHQLNFTGCSFEFNTDKYVKLYNPDGVVFSGCYTEDKAITFSVIATDDYPNPKSLTIRDSWIDVQRQSSVTSTADTECIKFLDQRTVKTPIPGKFLIDGITWQSAAVSPSSSAVGRYVKADNTFKNIVITGSTYIVANEPVDSYLLSTSNNSDAKGSLLRLYDGAGVQYDDSLMDNNPIKNGEFYQEIIDESSMDTLDPDRENNSGWWVSSGSASPRSGGVIRLNAGASISIVIPVPVKSGLYERGFGEDTFFSGNLYWLDVGYMYGSGSISISTITGGTESSSIIDDNYTGSLPTSTYTANGLSVPFYIDDGSEYVKITIAAISNMDVFRAKARLSSTIATTSKARGEGYPYS